MARRPRCSTGEGASRLLICALLAAAAQMTPEERRRVPHGQVAGASVDDHGRQRLGQRGEVWRTLGSARSPRSAGVDGALQPGGEGRGRLLLPNIQYAYTAVLLGRRRKPKLVERFLLLRPSTAIASSGAVYLNNEARRRRFRVCLTPSWLKDNHDRTQQSLESLAARGVTP